ncbi:MAG: polymer-forming cytoskeletal protein [Burkholderiales bacterium]|nr:polymer-forming cytoskeletal protein [Burkholderiales bacterium]
MLNRDAFFKKREEPPRRNVNVTPALTTTEPLPEAAPRDNITPVSPRSPAPAASERSRSEPAQGSKLIVGPDIKLKGVEITDCDTLVVEGTVEAAMDSRVIQIAERGVFKGTVSIDIAEIHGRFDGELTAREQLIVHASGKLSGKIRYGRIKIEEGGELCGDIARTDAAKPQRSAATLLKPAGTGD